MNDATKRLIDVALAYADSLVWDISDSGHAGVCGDYDLSEELAEAADAYKETHGIPISDGRARQRAVASLASLVRR